MNGWLWCWLRSWFQQRDLRYYPGLTVVNRYSCTTAKLECYLGPYIGYGDDEDGWQLDEEWLTTDGNKIAVGYFWRPPL